MNREDATPSRVLPFLVSFITTLLIMATLLCLAVILGGSDASPTAAAPEDAPAAVYLPREEDRLVLLLAGQEDSETLPDIYLLLGFFPDRGRISVCLLPPKTMVTAGEAAATLEEQYRRGGIAYAGKMLGSYLGFTVDRSGVIDVEGLKKLMETAGEFEYFLPVELDYPLHRRQVTMTRGSYRLDGRKTADILAYPAYPGGEIERSDRGAMLVTQMINHHMAIALTPQGDAVVRSLMNNAATDLSWKDYEERRGSVRFLSALELPAATAVYIEGALSRDYSSFLLTESCRLRLGEIYSGR